MKLLFLGFVIESTLERTMDDTKLEGKNLYTYRLKTVKLIICALLGKNGCIYWERHKGWTSDLHPYQP